MKNELKHYGIPHQSWGDRNGPPYPLKRSISNQIKRGYNPKERQNEEYRRERERLKSGEDVKTEGKSLRRKDDDLNDTIYKRFEEEAKMINSYKKAMSGMERKKYDKMMQRMEQDNYYNEMLQRRIQSQIELIQAEQTLKQLTEKPKKKSAIRRGSEFVGELGKDMLRQGVYGAGMQASAIITSELMNKAFRNYYNRRGY